jgi:RimJ/RimL family protein N-acetyltransferase
MLNPATTLTNSGTLPKSVAIESAANAAYLFYSSEGCAMPTCDLPAGYRFSFWWPSAKQPWPRNACDNRMRARFFFRYLLHAARLFSGRGCGAICMYRGDDLVHYSGFTPGYWRFPFLPDQDLQIGDTWTDPAHRGRGLAQFAVSQILWLMRRPGRQFWYVVATANAPSIQVAEKSGFALAGEGPWRRPFGIKLLGYYDLKKRRPAASSAEEKAAA